MTRLTQWWHQDAFNRRLPLLRARARIKAEVRGRTFLARDFDEVETPILQVSPGQRDPYREFCHRSRRATTAACDADASPHVAGIRLQDAARRRPAPPLHPGAGLPQPRAGAAAPSRIHDAGMVSRRGDASTTLMADCTALLRHRRRRMRHDAPCVYRGRGRRSHRARSWSSASARRSASTPASISTPCCRRRPTPFRRVSPRRRGASGIRVADDDTWSDLFSKILGERHRAPSSACGRPTFLTRYPASEAALARPLPGRRAFRGTVRALRLRRRARERLRRIA